MYRGQDFRHEYSCICELRSIFPDVNVMALTATASDTLRMHIVHDLGMYKPLIVQVSPDRSNLCYSVEKYTDIVEILNVLVRDLQKERVTFPRTILFCQKQVDCGWLYQFFLRSMGENMTETIGSPISQLNSRLVDVFTKSTEEKVKTHVLNELSKRESKLRLLICTAAFGMGIDCTSVNRVIHWGPPNDSETYIQQTGRAGRNGETSYCIILYGTGLSRFADKAMVDYCKNLDSCRRNVLFKDFQMYQSTPVKCACCDICAALCKCAQCMILLNNLKFIR